VVNGFARFVQSMGEGVGLQEASTAGDEHLANRRFAARNAAGQPYSQHDSPRKSIVSAAYRMVPTQYICGSFTCAREAFTTEQTPRVVEPLQ